MKKIIYLWFISIFISVMVFLSVFAMTSGMSTTFATKNSEPFYPAASDEGDSSYVVPDISLPKKEWTFMVYMAADNNLDPAALDDINEMEMVGSTDEVNIVVFLDRWDKEVGPGSWIYYIVYDENPEEIASPIYVSLGEMNSGDSSTLRFFVSYVTECFPAEKYALVLWDHGYGWFGVCWDWTDGDYLDIDEIRSALDGYELTLIGFDACLMSMIEVAYEFVGVADVMVASEAYEPWDGWPYDMFLASLVDNPNTAAEDLAKEIVMNYIDSYSEDGLLSTFVTMAAIDLNTLETLVELIDNLAVFLMDHLPEYLSVITGAKNSADRYPFGFCPSGPFIDLYHFVSLLGKYCTSLSDNLKLKSKVEDILDTWGDVVIIAMSYNKTHKHALGLTIYFPRNTKIEYYPEEYRSVGLDFTSETSWDEFLATYFSYFGPETCHQHKT